MFTKIVIMVSILTAVTGGPTVATNLEVPTPESFSASTSFGYIP